MKRLPGVAVWGHKFGKHLQAYTSPAFASEDYAGDATPVRVHIIETSELRKLVEAAEIVEATKNIHIRGWGMVHDQSLYDAMMAAVKAGKEFGMPVIEGK
jgi:hypothetical protein